MDVRSVIKEITVRIERRKGQANGLSKAAAISDGGPDLGALRDAYERLYQSRLLVGKLPPSPNTLRARVGLVFVRLVQRMLFWYTPQVARFQNDSSVVLGIVCDTLERQAAQLAELREGVRAGGATRPALCAISLEPTSKPEPAPALPLDFLFALQDRFRGSEASVSEKLAVYLGHIEAHLRETSGCSTWLDLGCGRGEWLSLAGAPGREVRGLDASASAAAYCRARGLVVECDDALRYLRGVPAQSLDVVTAFHFLEHCDPDYLLALMPAIARVLRPDGLLVVETPNPANVAVAANSFWIDPTHRRVLPAPLLEFLFEYHGFRVARRLELNASAGPEPLPYGEIDLVGRVNGRLDSLDKHFHAPQDYGLIGLRTA